MSPAGNLEEVLSALLLSNKSNFILSKKQIFASFQLDKFDFATLTWTIPVKIIKWAAEISILSLGNVAISRPNCITIFFIFWTFLVLFFNFKARL